MYEIEGKRTKTWNPFVGCQHMCYYCYAKKIAKRQKHRCLKCYNFEPHFHPERLQQKFSKNNTYFVCSMGDIAFASNETKKQILNTIALHPNTTFYLQSKNPRVAFDSFHFPNNLIIGTTIETNRCSSKTKAPDPEERYKHLQAIEHRKYVTIEPIMDFDIDIMAEWIKRINPEFVYIGYDNHQNKLDEPPLEKTKKLIEILEIFTQVRQKTIRDAWWEDE